VWGYAFTGVLLVKIATLGLAVLAMIAFMIRGGVAVVLPQIVVFAVSSLLAIALMARFVLSIGSDDGPAQGTPSPGRPNETR